MLAEIDAKLTRVTRAEGALARACEPIFSRFKTRADAITR